MLSYQHIYHAGNTADVHKHLWLIRTLDTLKSAGRPFTWIDTHAGRGLYDLHSAEAQKLREYDAGISPFLKTRLSENDLSRPERLYLDLVHGMNVEGDLRYYPGSAMIAAQMLGELDRFYAFERHKGEYPFLQHSLAPFSFASAKMVDGYEGLAKLLPPTPRRGGVLIDPSYERAEEYEQVIKTVDSILKKWPEAVILIWYPVLAAGWHEALKRLALALRPAPVIDEKIWRTDGPGMRGSGIIAFNAPAL